MAIAEDYNIESLNIISGNLEVRLAENSLEIDAAQALRYKVVSSSYGDVSGSSCVSCHGFPVHLQ